MSEHTKSKVMSSKVIHESMGNGMMMSEKEMQTMANKMMKGKEMERSKMAGKKMM